MKGGDGNQGGIKAAGRREGRRVNVEGGRGRSGRERGGKGEGKKDRETRIKNRREERQKKKYE